MRGKSAALAGDHAAHVARDAGRFIGAERSAVQSGRTSNSEVARLQPCPPSDSCWHAGADFFAVMKCKYKIGCIVSCQDPVRPRDALDSPPDAFKRGKYPACSSTAPRTHAAANRISMDSRGSSPASIRSARTRSASASALPIASARVWPYFITPGRPTTSAIQRPSSSRSVSIVKRIPYPSDFTQSSADNASASPSEPIRPSFEQADRQTNATPLTVLSGSEGLHPREQYRGVFRVRTGWNGGHRVREHGIEAVASTGTTRGCPYSCTYRSEEGCRDPRIDGLGFRPAPSIFVRQTRSPWARLAPLGQAANWPRGLYGSQMRGPLRKSLE